jgi:hypothetical protein
VAVDGGGFVVVVGFAEAVGVVMAVYVLVVFVKAMAVVAAVVIVVARELGMMEGPRKAVAKGRLSRCSRGRVAHLVLSSGPPWLGNGEGGCLRGVHCQRAAKGEC